MVYVTSYVTCVFQLLCLPVLFEFDFEDPFLFFFNLNATNKTDGLLKLILRGLLSQMGFFFTFLLRWLILFI